MSRLQWPSVPSHPNFMKSTTTAILFALASSGAIAATSECATKVIDGMQITWSGACKEGLPDGKGILEHKAGGELRMQYEGDVVGGVPHGKGYMKTAGGSEYEGDFVHGKREGQGIHASAWGDRYEGAFRNNKPDGAGAIEYAMGGSYKGQWKDGRPHGQGVAVYAGGRRAEGEFADGALAGDPRPAAAGKAAASAPSYALRVAPHRIGIVGGRENVFGSNVPYHKSYADLNAEEKAAVRAAWPMLDSSDVPPYPLNGTREIFEWLSRAQEKRLVSGEVKMKVMVDRDGNATAVKVLSSPDAALTQFVSAVLIKQKYSPALCQGTPCAMVYPFNSRLSIGRTPARR